MFKIFKYELLVLALAFCVLQYGRLQNDLHAQQGFLQSDRGDEELQTEGNMTDTPEIKASMEESRSTIIDQHLYFGVSATPPHMMHNEHSLRVEFSA